MALTYSKLVSLDETLDETLAETLADTLADTPHHHRAYGRPGFGVLPRGFQVSGGGGLANAECRLGAYGRVGAKTRQRVYPPQRGYSPGYSTLTF